MGSCVVNYITVGLLFELGIFMSNNMIKPASGQCTVQGCEKGDSSNGITAEIQEIKDFIISNLQAVDRRSKEQIQNIYEFLNMSFQQMKNQHDIVMLNLQGIDRRLQDQDAYIKRIENNHEILNASHQEIKNLNATLQQIKDLQDIATTSLQAVELRSQEQRICLSQVQSVSEFLNASFQQTQNQQVSAMISLVAIDRRLNEHDIFVRNQTEIILELTKLNAFGTADWIVIMHRFDGSENFSRTWDEYKNGFGCKGGEFWLGNEEVHRLTSRFNCTLRVEVQLKASGRWYNAEYSTFSLESENNKYTLRLSGYSGNAGDSLANTSLNSYGYPVGMKFSTLDNDNDRRSTGNCTQSWPGGWWFNNCFHSCLTCHYPTEFKWYYYSGWPTSGLLRAARMRIRKK